MREVLHKKATETPKRSAALILPSRTRSPNSVAVLQSTVGNQAVRRLFVSGLLQAKLRIGQANDIYEQEADRVADQVMRMPDTAVDSRQSITPFIQRQVEEEEEPVQMKREDGGTTSLASSVESSITSLRGGGKPLSDPEREFFETRFGADLGSVRLHTGAEAGRLSRALGAEAFTVGTHVYFSPGSYYPDRSCGRRLLAHELTHVVQQAGAHPSSLGIQRKLLVTGKQADIEALLDLLEPASGFTLKHDLKTRKVSIVASRLKPASFVLAGRLATIIDDPAQDAELELGRRQTAVGFGAFPFSGPLLQKIDIDDMARLEAKAHGSGVAFLIHEIVENYKAHEPSMQEFRREAVFGTLHEEALEAERLVAQELVGLPGGRVADALAMIGSGIMRRVDDYESYFLVMDHRLDVLIAARRVDRVNVSKYTIGGFASGSVVLPSAARPTIAAVVDDLVANPLATVLIKSGDVDPALAQQRAEEIQDAILTAGKGRKGFDLRSERNFNLVGFGLIDIGKAGTSGLMMITVDRPDTEAEAERGRLVKKVMSATRRRN